MAQGRRIHMYTFDHWPTSFSREHQHIYMHIYTFVHSLIIVPAAEAKAGITWFELFFLFKLLGGADVFVAAGPNTNDTVKHHLAAFQHYVRAVIKAFVHDDDKEFFKAPLCRSCGLRTSVS